MDALVLLAKKSALKDVEIWLHQQYQEIDRQIAEIEEKQLEAEKANA